MSYADKVFIDMCRDIIDNGVSTEGEKVHPKFGTFHSAIARTASARAHSTSILVKSTSVLSRAAESSESLPLRRS